MNMLSLWPIISKYSKNLIVDGIIYDFLLIIGFYGTMIVMGVINSFSTCQWIGVITAIIGIVLLKIGG